MVKSGKSGTNTKKSGTLKGIEKPKSKSDKSKFVEPFVKQSKLEDPSIDSTKTTQPKKCEGFYESVLPINPYKLDSLINYHPARFNYSNLFGHQRVFVAQKIYCNLSVDKHAKKIYSHVTRIVTVQQKTEDEFTITVRHPQSFVAIVNDDMLIV